MILNVLGFLDSALCRVLTCVNLEKYIAKFIRFTSRKVPFERGQDFS